MQPLQYDLRLSAAKDNSIPHAAAAARNLDAAIPLRSADTSLQNTMAQRQEKREKALSTRSYIARAKRTGIGGEATTAAPVAHASQLFSATEPALT